MIQLLTAINWPAFNHCDDEKKREYHNKQGSFVVVVELDHGTILLLS